MKATCNKLAAALVLTFGMAGCVPASTAPTPAPAPVTRPGPMPAPVAPPPVQAAPNVGWMDVPATAGNWRYQISNSGPVAIFVGAQGTGEWLMSCDRTGRAIAFWRAGASPVPRTMTIRTETATRSLRVVQAEDTNPYLTADVASTDALLDAMALSKGRFAVEVEGLPTLYLPSWAEVSRVIEDCRG